MLLEHTAIAAGHQFVQSRFSVIAEVLRRRQSDGEQRLAEQHAGAGFGDRNTVAVLHRLAVSGPDLHLRDHADQSALAIQQRPARGAGTAKLFDTSTLSRPRSTRMRNCPSDQMMLLDPPGCPIVCTVSPGRSESELPQARLSLPAPGANSRHASSPSRRAYFSTFVACCERSVAVSPACDRMQRADRHCAALRRPHAAAKARPPDPARPAPEPGKWRRSLRCRHPAPRRERCTAYWQSSCAQWIGDLGASRAYHRKKCGRFARPGFTPPSPTPCGGRAESGRAKTIR